MAEVIRMPKMSDTMTEGVVAKWHKKVGDQIKSGELVAEIETDKATMEFESFQSGTLLHIGIGEGKAVPVDAIIAILGKPGEDFKHLLEAPSSPPVLPAVEPTPAKTVVSQPSPKPTPKPLPSTTQVQIQDSEESEKLRVSPLAKRLAVEKGIDLSRLQGSGDHGRIIKRDIDFYKPIPIAESRKQSGEAKESTREVPLSQMRKTIAKRLSESKFSAPHFYLTMDILMDEAMKAREAINGVASSKISFNDLVVKAAAESLLQNPEVNASWSGNSILYHGHVHIGVAVAVEEGLLVPVIKFANRKTLSEISGETKEMAKKAKEKKLQPSDWEGNTFTISNLGMFGIDSFTAIINPPDACILAVGAIKPSPVIKDGRIKAGHVMKVTLSCDHRVVDGAKGAKFLQTLKYLLENPVILLGADSI